MKYMIFERSEGADGVITLEALVSTDAAGYVAALAEVNQVLDWAWCHFPDRHAPAEDGGDWDHDLQITVEDGRWWVIALTVSGRPSVLDELASVFLN